MKQITKLTTISRKDLTPGQQAVQASHAAIDFIFSFPEESKHWHKLSNYIINLSAIDEDHLESLSKFLCKHDIKFVKFTEPDLDDKLTAIAFLSNDITKRITSNLPLALKINSFLKMN